MKNTFKRTYVFQILTTVFLFTLFSCGSVDKSEKEKNENAKHETVTTDASEPDNKNWIDVQSSISRMDSTTTYKEIVDTLGKPYDEYINPNQENEYMIFYDVPGVEAAFFWIMLDKKTKTFLHWSGEKGEK